MRYLLYDSNCPFCNKVVEKISKLINDKKVKILAINSKKGSHIIKKNNLENVNSVIYVNSKGETYIKSKAIIKISLLMRFPFNIAYIFNILPNRILDFIYDFVAKNRMKIKI
mgnify:CR=1 FL=1